MNRRALLLVSVFVVACSGAQSPSEGTSQQRTARDYFPLAANAAWSFEATSMDNSPAPGLITMRVVQDQGEGRFMVSTGTGRNVPAVYQFRDGDLQRNGETVLRAPFTDGATWTAASNDRYEIAHTGLTRTVPAGTFRNVIEVVHTSPSATLVDGTQYREVYWYAPGVGPIEAEVPILLEHSVRRYRLTLRGYTLNGEF